MQSRRSWLRADRWILTILVIAAAPVGCHKKDDAGGQQGAGQEASAGAQASPNLVVRIGGVSVLKGDLAVDAVRRQASSAMGALRTCCDAGVKMDPNLRGQVNVTATIEASGAVSSANRSGGALPQTIATCMSDAIKAATFEPRTSGPAEVTIAILCGSK